MSCSIKRPRCAPRKLIGSRIFSKSFVFFAGTLIGFGWNLKAHVRFGRLGFTFKRQMMVCLFTNKSFVVTMDSVWYDN